MAELTSYDVINEFLWRVHDAAYNSCVFWNGNNPGGSRMQVHLLGPRTVGKPEVDDLVDQETNAGHVMWLLREHAISTTVYRRARSGMKWSRTDGSSGTWDDRTDVCRLNDDYKIDYGQMWLTAGHEVNWATYEHQVWQLRQNYAHAQHSAWIPDLRVCHDSCHSSCHSSRGRR